MSESKPLLSPVQKKLVGAGLSAAAALLLLFTLAFGMWLLIRFLGYFQDVLLPVAIAAIFATLLRPAVNILADRCRLGHNGAILLLYCALLATFAAALYLLLPIAIRQGQSFVQQLPVLFENVQTFLESHFPAEKESLSNHFSGRSLVEVLNDLREQTEVAFQDIAWTVLSQLEGLSSTAGAVFGKIAAYAVIPVYCFFILSNRNNTWDDVRAQLSFLDEKRQRDVLFLMQEFADIVVAFFRGKLLIGCILAVFLAIGFSVIGLKFGIVVGIIVGLLNIIPYLGTILGALTVLPLAYFQPEGGWAILGLAAAIFTASQLFEDYVLMPRIMKGKTGMGPMLLIFSIFFWGTAIGGILGLLLAIPLTACFLVFWRLFKEEYLPVWIETKGK